MQRTISSCLCILAMSFAVPSFASRYYVNAAVEQSGDGTSWATAKKTISEALAPDKATEIWVAKGTYTETITFRNGIELYGSFSGNETSTDERKLSNHPTILDGSKSANGKPIGHIMMLTEIDRGRIDGFIIRGARIEASATEPSGAAVLCQKVSKDVSITNCLFQNNESGKFGGALSLIDSSPLIQNCAFENNHSVEGGGAIYCKGAKSEIRGCSFKGNSGSSGGAILCIGKKVIVSQCSFDKNTASYGGAIFFSMNDEGYVTQCTFNENSAKNYWAYEDTKQKKTARIEYGSGGALFIDYSIMQLNQLKFIGNSAGETGGALHVTAAKIYGNNCLFADNSCFGTRSGQTEEKFGSGGGVFCHNGSTFSHCTFVNNRSVSGGSFFEKEGKALLQNCIFAGNIGKALYEENANAHIKPVNCLFDGNADGDFLMAGHETITGAALVNEKVNYASQNISASPDFLDAKQGDYHLLPSSPAIDHGVTLDVLKDLDGNKRPFAVPSGRDNFAGKYDIGCYEFVGQIKRPLLAEVK